MTEIVNYYTSQKSKLLRDFDYAAKSMKKVLVLHYGDELAETVAKDMRQEFEAIIPNLPDIGGSEKLKKEGYNLYAQCEFEGD